MQTIQSLVTNCLVFHFIVLNAVEASDTEAMVGRSARLGCNMTVPEDDAVYLVLWFKQGLATPIYR